VTEATAGARSSGRALAGTPVRHPAWLRWGSLVLCVLGLAVSAYLTYEHYSSSTSLACPDTGAINCLKVTTSSYSKILGIPVALLGLLFYVGMTVLCLPPAWSAANPWVGRVRLLGAVSGVVLVVYLVWAELFRIDAICLWCTAVHVLTVLLFGLLVVGAALQEA
jgi:uncharacterized membrane protein